MRNLNILKAKLIEVRHHNYLKFKKFEDWRSRRVKLFKKENWKNSRKWRDLRWKLHLKTITWSNFANRCKVGSRLFNVQSLRSILAGQYTKRNLIYKEKMEPNTEKLILAIVMFLVTALCSLIPFAPFSVFRHELNSRFNTIASCFSGGVFIAVCFLDMMPDIEEIFETIKTQLDVTLDFSFSGMVICLGFFFVLSLDQLILVCKERNNSVTP